MEVRPADVDDAGHLARMLHDFNLEFADPSPGIEKLEARVREFIELSVKTYLIAGDEPAGFAQLSFNASIWTEGPILLIEELYVRPALRRRGIGRRLMNSIIDLAREEGAGGLEVITGEDDAGARALYEAFGFQNEIEGESNSRSLFYEREL